MFHGLKAFSRNKSILVLVGVVLAFSQSGYGRAQIPFGFFKAPSPTMILSDGFESGFSGGVPLPWDLESQSVSQNTTHVSEGANAVSIGYSVTFEAFGKISREIDFTGAGTVSIVLTQIANYGPCFSHLLVKVDGTTIIDSGGTGGTGTYTAAVSYSGVHTLSIGMSASSTCSGTTFDDLKIY